MQPYAATVRAINQVVSPLPTNGSLRAIAEPIEVTAANQPLAREIVEALAKAGYQARLVDAPSGGATLILTEGTVATSPVELHWAALSQARKGYKTARSIVFLQRPSTGDASQMAGLEGVARTLRLEWPNINTVCLAMEEPSAAAVVGHLCAGLGDATIFANGGYSSQQIGAAIPPPIARGSVPRQTWLVTGGGRGITARCAIELAQSARGTFLLAGRSALAPWPAGIEPTDNLKALRAALAQAAKQAGQKLRLPDLDKTARAALAGQEIAATLAALHNAGSQAQYIQLDLADRAAVAQQLSLAEQSFGKITGLVHGAGVLSDRLALKKTREDFEAVFQPKVHGLQHILAALDVRALRYVGLFSSAAAAFGNPGQADYAAANACLDRFAEQLRTDQPNTQVKSFAWGPWDGGMVDATLAAAFADKGIALIDRDDGARIFAEQLLFGDPAQTRLLIGSDWGA